MRDERARESINLLLENDHRISAVLNDTRASGVWRFCQECDRETWQKIECRLPAIYYCPVCDTKWKPRIPDDKVSDCKEVVKEPMGFKIEAVSCDKVKPEPCPDLEAVCQDPDCKTCTVKQDKLENELLNGHKGKLCVFQDGLMLCQKDSCADCWIYLKTHPANTTKQEYTNGD